MVARGGGARDIELCVHPLPSSDGRMLVVHLLVDTRDAMGANLVNTHVRRRGAAGRGDHRRQGVPAHPVEPRRPLARARARAASPSSSSRAAGYTGAQVRDGIIVAADFAAVDPYRAATHNKGIMNGIDAVALATGNDWRAIEAGAHAYAARGGRYSSLTDWWADEEGNLCGRIELPIKVGIVGGPLESNPTVALNLRLLGVESATRARAGHGRRRPRAELRRDARARDRGHPEGPHDAACAQRRHGGRRAERASSTRSSTGLIQSGDIKVWKAQEIVAEMQEERRRTKSGRRPKRSQEAAHGRRLRQSHPARRARGRLWPARDRGADSADDQGARRGLRRGHPSADPALGRGIPPREQPERTAVVRAPGRRRARPARPERTAR